MNLLKEFLQWRKSRKSLANSWAAPYADHPETESVTTYSEYKVKNPLLMTDTEACLNYFAGMDRFLIKEENNSVPIK